jgi:5-methylcytosine-specific restriction enzyme subunit McrC
MSPVAGATNRYEITPGRHIGSVQLGDLSVEIRPKIAIQHVVFMLSYVLGDRKELDQPFLFEKDPSILEAVIPSFVAHVQRAIRLGILQGYRSEGAALNTVRGRIRFDEHIKRRFGVAPPIEVCFDEFTEDIDENRLIKAAIARLGRQRIRNRSVRESLRRFDAALLPVADVVYDRKHLPEITWNRLNERYRPAVELAKIILQGSSFEIKHGNVLGTAVLFDMAKVVEDFIVVALRDAMDLSERFLVQGGKAKGLHLDVDQQIRLKPDLSWWDGNLCRFVGDVKYKIADDGANEHDLYQLLAYTIAYSGPS